MRFFLLMVMMVMAVHGQEECVAEDTTFELVTGYVLTAPEEIIDTLADTLQLADCIETCRKNDTCKALNFETGLCVLFRTSALEAPGKLPFLGLVIFANIYILWDPMNSL